MALVYSKKAEVISTGEALSMWVEERQKKARVKEVDRVRPELCDPLVQLDVSREN